MNGISRLLRNRFPTPLLAAFAVLLIYDAPLLLMRGLGLGMDGLRQYYPAEHVLANALRNGTLPFWTPNLQAGFPLFAEGQPGGVYPINVLALILLPTPVAHNAIIVVHHGLGLLFTFWWGRTLQLSRVAAGWMALVFALTTWLAGNDILLIETTTWVPLLFVLTERLVQQGRPLAVVSAVPILAMQWLGGFPQIALYTALSTHIYLAVRVCGEPWPWSRRVRTLAIWGAAVLLGVLLAAPQLLPQYELSQFSIRAGGIRGSLSGEKSLLPAALITLVLPSWREFFASAGLGMGIYLGLLPCLLALAAVINGPRPRWCWGLVAVAVVATVLAFGHFNPLFPLTRSLPGFAFFRYPSRFMVFTQFCLVTFFGLGWDRLSTASASRFERTLRRLLLAAATLALLNVAVVYPLLLWLRPQLTTYAERYTERYILTDPYHLQPLAYFQAKINALYSALLAAAWWQRLDTMLVLTVAAAGIVVVLWAGAQSQRQSWRQVFFGGLVLLDVLAFAGGVHRTDPVTWVTTDPPSTRVATQLGGPPPCRLFWLADAKSVANFREDRVRLVANYNLIFDLPTTGVYAPLGFDAYYRLMDRLGTVDLGFGLRPVTPDDITHDRALLDFLNVCYVLSREPLAGFNEVAQVDGVWVYRNERAAPRAFAVDQVEEVGSVDAALTWVKAHPERLRDMAVVDAALGTRPDPGAARGAVVRVVDYQPMSARIEIAAPGAVLLVLTDTYYPGWEVRIDDVAAPLYRADGLFRAVSVAAGAHRVQFQYVPVTFRWGLSTAAAAAAVTAVWALYARRRALPR